MDIVSKQTGTQLSAEEFNQIPDELEEIIKSAGITPSDQVLTQISSAIAQIVADGRFFSTDGTANVITLANVSPRKAVTSLKNGVNGIFKANLDNTGAVTINLCGLGAKNAYINSAELVAGDIKAGKYYNFIYDE